MQRRRFDHLVLEISLAANRNLPRYRLWLTLKELGMDPDRLTRKSAIEFCERGLPEFLAHHGCGLSPRRIRGLMRSVARYDPARLTPAERVAQI